MEQKELGDRQLDALLERLDRLTEEVARLGRKLEQSEGLIRIAHELSALNESLNAFARVEPGMRALDVGCGPGALTTALAGRLGAGNVCAADPSEPFAEAC